MMPVISKIHQNVAKGSVAFGNSFLSLNIRFHMNETRGTTGDNSQQANILIEGYNPISP